MTLLLLGFGLAYANGANDVSKGIATLVGSGVTDCARALRWGALCTAAGGLLGAVLGGAMVRTFGAGLLSAGVVPTFAAAAATLAGAAAWVLLSTRTGLPVSTTHALVGSLAGVAWMAYGPAGMRWGALGGQVFLPLLASPLVAVAGTLALLAWTRGPAAAVDCVCAQVTPAALSPTPDGAALLAPAALRIVTGSSAQCAAEAPNAIRFTRDRLHWLTSGAAAGGRALNDAPKIVGLILAASLTGGAAAPSSPLLFAVVTAGMVGGSLAAGRRVTRVLAEKVTPLDAREGSSANLVTAALVGSGALLGLPMSATHVSAGAISAVGLSRHSLDGRTLRDIALAWGVTLPAGALLGMAAYALVRWL
ncbi:MAG: inorganic phosphate transporter [Myxococcales bacterium]